MPYIDTTYYKETYKGRTFNIENKELEINIRRASDTIDILTGFKLKDGSIDIEKVHSFIRENVKKATAALTEHYILNGGYDSLADTSMSSVNIGGFSYKMSTGENETMAPHNVVSFLSTTGLLYAGIDTSDGSVHYEH